MSKKKINIILIPSAIAIWVIILLRVLDFGGPAGKSYSGKNLQDIKKVDAASTDTLQLLLDYRDPFVAGASPFIRKNKESKAQEIFQKPKIVTPPSVVYQGLVDPGKDRKEIALTIINNRSFLAAKNDTIMGLRIVNIFRDSLIVEYQKSLFTFKNTQQKKI
jgi:hypothetical protein